MKRFLSLSLCVLAFPLCAEPLYQWKHQSERDLARDRMSFHCAKDCQTSRTIVTEEDGRKVLCVTFDRVAAGSRPHDIQINHNCGGKLLKDGRSYRLRFRYRGDQPGVITAMAAQTGAPYKNFSIPKQFSVKPEYQDGTIEFRQAAYPDDGLTFRIFAATYPQGAKLYFDDVTLEAAE